VFAAAVAKHQILAHTAWHIGDSWQDDYEGAENAGLKGIWLNRDGHRPVFQGSRRANGDHRQALPATSQAEIADLSELSLTAER
jgi:putative hydrolase of the HAD superfamily